MYRIMHRQLNLNGNKCPIRRPVHALGIASDPKGREAHFQDFAYVLVLKGVGPSEALLVQKEKKYSLGTFSSGRRLHTIPYHTIP